MFWTVREIGATHWARLGVTGPEKEVEAGRFRYLCPFLRGQGGQAPAEVRRDQAPPIVLEAVLEVKAYEPGASSDSQEEPPRPLRYRRSKYVVVELPGATSLGRVGGGGSSGIARNSQASPISLSIYPRMPTLRPGRGLED